MKQNILRFIGIILIATGFAIIGKTIYDKIETKKNQDILMEVFQQVDEVEEIEDNSNNDLDSVKEGFTPIAILEIPSINFRQVVVETVTNKAIKYYVGHFEGTAMPGQKGNFAVAAHNVSSFSDAFKNLHKLKSGDLVKVKTKDMEYIYEVSENFIVTPDRVDVLSQTKTETITLLTCTANGKKRVVVKGFLKDSNEL